MRQINETMQVRMTLDEANLVNELLKRNEAEAPRLGEWEYEGETKKKYICPNCGHAYFTTVPSFCMECGQRLDTENVAF